MKIIKQLKNKPRLGGLPPARQSARDNVPAVSSATDTNAVNAQVEQLAQTRAREIIAEQQQAQVLARNGRTFTKFDAVNDIVDNQTETVTAGLWSDNVASLTTYFTSSTQTTSQRRYYVDVFQKDPAATGSAVQFSAAYGNANGSG